MNCHIQVAGRQVQFTCARCDEARLLERSQAVLALLPRAPAYAAGRQPANPPRHKPLGWTSASCTFARCIRWQMRRNDGKEGRKGWHPTGRRRAGAKGAGMSAPRRPPEAVEADGYTALIAAIISRALSRCPGPLSSHRPATPEPPRPGSASAWLSRTKPPSQRLLELGGYDAAPVLRGYERGRIEPSQGR